MINILKLTLLFISLASGAVNLNSLSIVQNGKFTQLLPEISGIEYENGYFGTAVATDGEYMVVSAANSFFRGAVAIYRKSGSQWQLMQMIDTVGFDGLDNFGSSVDISDGKMIIGADQSRITDDEAGAVLYYELNDGIWEYSKTILSPLSREGGRFGSEVVLKGSTAVVTENSGFDQPGLVYIYTINNGDWQLTKTIDDMDLVNQTGVSSFNIDFDENHMVISRSDGYHSSLIRVYDLTDTSWETYQVIESPVPSENFSSSVSLDGDRLVLADKDFNRDAGVVYFYEKIDSVWQLEQTINGPEQDSYKAFGSSVQLSGDTLLVGSYSDDETAAGAGAAFYYQYINGQWIEQQKLLASDGAKFDNFGSRAELNGDEIIISATGADTDFINAGKVYSFQLSDGIWNENQVITPSPAVNGSIFGNGLALNDLWVVVGADGDSDFGDDSGAVYLYKKSQGSLSFVEKIYAQEPQSNQQFGKNIVIEDDVMLISAAGNTEIDGYVHYYKLESNHWVYQAKFNAADTLPADYFGYGLSLDGNLLAVSALYHEDGANVGAVYMFALQDNQWTEQEKLSFSSDENLAGLGFDLSLSDSRLAVGTFGAGKAYVFEKTENNWLQTHELSEPSSEFGFAFGYSVNIANNQLIVSNGDRSPLVYNFNGSELSAPGLLDEEINNNFDLVRDIAVNEDWLILTQTGINGRSEALVYRYIENQWQFIHNLSKPITGSKYWNDVHIYGDEVLIGDFTNSQRGDANGAAYWVQDLADANFKINQGLNGNWYNTETSGQGIFFDVVPSKDFSFMGWFTYDTTSSNDDTEGQIGAEGHRWLVGDGLIDQAQLTINYQLTFAYDGLFDDSKDATIFNTAPYGSMSVKFESCSKAEVSYQIFGTELSNSYSIERPVGSTGELCDYFAGDMNNDTEPFTTFDYRLNGAWFNPETPGQGLFIDKFLGTNAAFMGWFTYDTTLAEGTDESQIGALGQRWLVGLGEANPNSNIINYQLYYSEGGLFDNPLDPTVIGGDGYGNLSIEFVDCAHANVTYEIGVENLSGSYSIVRAVPDPAVCDEVND